MAQRLRVGSAFVEDPSWVPSTHPPVRPAQEIQHPLPETPATIYANPHAEAHDKKDKTIFFKGNKRP